MQFREKLQLKRSSNLSVTQLILHRFSFACLFLLCYWTDLRVWIRTFPVRRSNQQMYNRDPANWESKDLQCIHICSGYDNFLFLMDVYILYLFSLYINFQISQHSTNGWGLRFMLVKGIPPPRKLPWNRFKSSLLRVGKSSDLNQHLDVLGAGRH